MGVSRLTAMMVFSNDVEIIKNESHQRWEAWVIKNGHLHALALSAPLDKEQELRDAVTALKKELCL